MQYPHKSDSRHCALVPGGRRPWPGGPHVAGLDAGGRPAGRPAAEHWGHVSAVVQRSRQGKGVLRCADPKKIIQSKTSSVQLKYQHQCSLVFSRVSRVLPRADRLELAH